MSGEDDFDVPLAKCTHPSPEAIRVHPMAVRPGRYSWWCHDCHREVSGPDIRPYGEALAAELRRCPELITRVGARDGEEWQ